MNSPGPRGRSMWRSTGFGLQRQLLLSYGCLRRPAEFCCQNAVDFFTQDGTVNFGCLPDFLPVDPEICMDENVPEGDDLRHGICGKRSVSSSEMRAATSPMMASFCTTALRTSSD